MFAFLYVFKNYYFNAIESSHGVFDRYILLNLSMILSLLATITSYFTPSLYFYVIYATIAQISTTIDPTQIIAKIFALIFVLVYMVAIAGGLSGSVWTKHA